MGALRSPCSAPICSARVRDRLQSRPQLLPALRARAARARGSLPRGRRGGVGRDVGRSGPGRGRQPVRVDPLRRRRARRGGRRARQPHGLVPYPKALTANPFVNQGAALLVTDTDTARAARSGRGTMGLPPRWCGSRRTRGSAHARVAYHRVPALEATIRDVQDVTGVAVADADHAELYSCFPAMPKLTRRAMGRPVDAPDLVDRRAVVLRWSGEQLPDPCGRDHGRAHPDRRRHRCRARGRDVQHEAPRPGVGRPPASRRELSGTGPRHRCRAAPGRGPGAGGGGLRRPGHGPHVHRDVRPRRPTRTRAR